MKNAKTKKTLSIVLNVIIWLFVAFAVVITILVIAAQSDSDKVPSIGGKCFINIVTDSMSPTFNEGDLIIGKKLSEEERTQLTADDPNTEEKEGDIITFEADLLGDGIRRLNTHRIIRINYDAEGNVISYVTKGDNKETNQVEDKDPVPCQNIICKYTGTRIKAVGGFLSFLQTSTGFLVVIVIPLILFFLYELYKFIVTFKQVKGKDKKVISAEEEELIKQKAIEEYLRQQAEAQNKSGAVAENVTDKAESVKEEVAGTAEEVKEEATEAVEEAKETAAEAAGTAEAAVENVKEEAAATVEEVKEEATEAVEEVKETASEVIEEAKETAEETAEDAAEAVKKAAENAASDITDNAE